MEPRQRLRNLLPEQPKMSDETVVDMDPGPLDEDGVPKEEELTTDEILIIGDGKSSNAAKEAESIVTTSMITRIFVWITGVWIGLFMNLFIEMSRFWWMTVTLVTALLWFFVTIAAIDPISLASFLVSESAGLIVSLIIGITTIQSFYNCAVSGDDCPVGDDTQFKRIFEFLFYVVFILQCAKTWLKLWSLNTMYGIEDEEVIKRHKQMHKFGRYRHRQRRDKVRI